MWGKEGSSRSNAAEKGEKTEPITQVKGLGNYQEANVFCKRKKNQLDVTICRLLGKRVGAGTGLSRFGCDCDDVMSGSGWQTCSQGWVPGVTKVTVLPASQTAGGRLSQDSTRGQRKSKGTGEALKYLMNKYRNQRVDR